MKGKEVSCHVFTHHSKSMGNGKGQCLEAVSSNRNWYSRNDHRRTRSLPQRAKMTHGLPSPLLRWLILDIVVRKVSGFEALALIWWLMYRQQSIVANKKLRLDSGWTKFSCSFRWWIAACIRGRGSWWTSSNGGQWAVCFQGLSVDTGKEIAQLNRGQRKSNSDCKVDILSNLEAYKPGHVLQRGRLST